MRNRGRWAWLVAFASVFAVVVCVIVDGSMDPAWATIVILVCTSLAAVGALLVARVPGNVVGFLMLAAAGGMALATVASTYGSLGSDPAGPVWPGAGAALALSDALYGEPLIISLIVIPLVFPTGHLLGPRWRWVAAIAILAMIVQPALRMAMASNDASPALEAANLVLSLSSVVGFGGAVVALVIRFRRGREVERMQLKWLLATAGVAAVFFPASFVLEAVAPAGSARVPGFLADLFYTGGIVAFMALPIAIGIAVLRYRLYEIDRLISRTIGWALVTAMLIAAFLLLVLASTELLRPLTGGNTLAVAGSTLIVVALFAPLRSRVQRAVDRRFDRARYDGERLLAAFGLRVRDEVDLETIRADILATVDAAVRPAHVGLWLRERR